MRKEGSVSCEDLSTNIIQQLELQVSPEERESIPLALGMKDSTKQLFQYRDFVDFCRHQNLYNFESIHGQQQQQQRRRSLLSVSNDGYGDDDDNGDMLSNGAATMEIRRGGGGALNRTATGGTSSRRRQSPRGDASVSDYAEVVKYKQLVDASAIQMESLTLQLHEREKDNRRLMDDVRQVSFVLHCCCFLCCLSSLRSYTCSLHPCTSTSIIHWCPLSFFYFFFNFFTKTA